MEDYEINQKQLLSPNIRLLGDILGEVLKEQSGDQLFALEERIRLLAKSFREDNNEDSFEELTDIIGDLNLDQTRTIIKAFSHFFRLANLAEEYYKIQLQQRLSASDQNGRSLEHAIDYAKQLRLGFKEFFQLLGMMNLQLIWTAHPTEARRLTILIKLRKIYTLLSQIQHHEQGSLGWIKLRQSVKEEITLLWQTDEIREERVDLLDEVRTVLFYFDNTLFDLVPELFKDFELQIKQAFNLPESESLDLPQLLEFGSWVGGDRDGHPGVTGTATIQTLLLHKRLCLRKYIQAVEGLIQHLSASTKITDVSIKLRQSLTDDMAQFPNFSQSTRALNIEEPYRRKLDFVRLKLENALLKVEDDAVHSGLGNTLVGYSIIDHQDIGYYYRRSAEFLEDLKMIYNSLIEHQGKSATGLLKSLIHQVEIFGFHLAPLDLRQDASYHFDVLNEIFTAIGLGDISSLSHEEQADLFIQELINPRPLGIGAIHEQLSQRAQEVYFTLQVAMESIQTISPRAMSTYIISMSKHERDVFGLMLLMKEVGILRIEHGKVVEAYMDIAPLFETRQDLKNASQVMGRLLNNDLYTSMLDKRQHIQEIMIGYSDSMKDVGMLESNFRLLDAQNQFVKLAEEYDIKIRVFHGRGGSVSRGGGPTNKAILALPPKTTMNLKITEQGEVIGSTYANPEIARNHLEGILSAMIVRAVDDTVKPDTVRPQMATYFETLRKLASYACTNYETLVKKHPGFIQFYLDFTPLDLIERATIGSRPSRRTGMDINTVTSLRAIPWVFSWMQSRTLFSAYYGVGSALKKFQEEEGLELLQDMYKNWPFFTALVDNLQMVLLKADMRIARQYLTEGEENFKQIFDIIVNEYQFAAGLILDITGNEHLMDYAPDLRRSILRRYPYIDPLNLIQANLIDLWRKEERPDDLSPSSLLRLLLETVNGVASGLKNTG